MDSSSSGNTENFTGECVEGDVVKHGDAVRIDDRQVLDGQTADLIGNIVAGDVELDLFADHHFGQGGFGRVLGIDGRDVFAAAQDRNAVGNGENFVELMGDDDDCLAVCAHVLNDGEELFDLLQGQNGGRFVKDEDVRTAVQYLDDLQRLLLRDGHGIDLLIGIDIEAVLCADLTDAAGNFFFVVSAALIQTENDVFCGGEDVDQLEVLVDHTDLQIVSVLGGANGNGFIVDIDLTGVGVIDTRQHIHQRGFARAVFTEQGQDLTVADIEIDILVCLDGAERFGNALHSDRASDFV